jgi:hypothetical protein
MKEARKSRMKEETIEAGSLERIVMRDQIW